MASIKSHLGEMTVNETYTRKQAMDRLGMSSINAFNQLTKKYSEVFVIVAKSKYKGKGVIYDKAAVDKFAQVRNSIKIMLE
jgi:hypothetical protein